MYLCSIQEAITLALPSLPRGVLSPEGEERLRGIPDRLPRAVAAAAFECRLLPGTDRVDFTCGLYRGSSQRALREGWAGARQPDDEPHGWDPARALLQRWADLEDDLCDHLDQVWLELDLDPAVATEPVPFLYVTPTTGRRPYGPDEVPALCSVVARCLEVLRAPISSQTVACLRRCAAALPAKGRFLQLAPIVHRADDTLRVVVSVPPLELEPYLERIGWPGDRAALTELLRATGASDWSAPLQLDVSAGVGPRVSFELRQEAGVAEDPRWARLLDFLCDVGACTAEGRRMISAWPTGRGRLVPRRDQPVQLHRLLQVKVLHDPGCPPRAKAYLGFQPQVVLFG